MCRKIWGKDYAKNVTGDVVFDCDEFPFAGTNQGWSCDSCGNDMSVRRMNKQPNQKAGSRFASWLVNDRILRNVDGFQVRVY
jgi:hypothetical protein